MESADAHRIVPPRGASLLLAEQQRGPVAYGVSRGHASQSYRGMSSRILAIPILVHFLQHNLGHSLHV